MKFVFTYNGLTPNRCQATIGIHDYFMSNQHVGTDFRTEIRIKILFFSLNKRHEKCCFHQKCCLTHTCVIRPQWVNSFPFRCRSSVWSQHQQTQNSRTAVTSWRSCTWQPRHNVSRKNKANWPMRHGPGINIKTVFSRYGDSHVKDKTVARPFYH